MWRNGTDSDVLNAGSPWVIVNIKRTDTGTYRCTAYNGIRNPVSHILYANVHCKYIGKYLHVQNRLLPNSCHRSFVKLTLQ